MSPTLLSFFFDATLALLLIVTISYCSKLNKKIRQLQDGRSELAEMIARFDQSTERATHSLAELQTVSKKITEALQLKIDKANFLADDLAFLIEKSSKLTTQLEQLQKQRAEALRQPAPAPSSFSTHSNFEPHLSSAERNAPPKAASPSKTGLEQLIAAGQQNTPSMSSPSVSSIEAMLQKLATNTAPKTSTGNDAAPRTNAERELLSALKTGRG